MILEVYPELIDEFQQSLTKFMHKESLKFIIDDTDGFFKVYVSADTDLLEDLECIVYSILAKMKQDGYDITLVKDIYLLKPPKNIIIKFE